MTKPDPTPFDPNRGSPNAVLLLWAVARIALLAIVLVGLCGALLVGLGQTGW